MASVKSKVPKLRFKGFSGEWNITKLCDISDKVQEKNKNNLITETFTNSAEYGIINQRDFFNKDISNEVNLCHYYVVQPNDFVYNPRISNLAPVGPIQRNKLNRTGVMSPLYYVFRTYSINNDFLDYYFSTSKWHRFMFMNGDKGARSDRFAIGDSVFRTMPILTPKQQEQTQIGNFFQKLDQVIELQQYALTQAQNYKKAMLQKMFPQNNKKLPKIRFKQISKDWNTQILGNILKTYSFKEYLSDACTTGRYPVIQQGEYPIIGYSNKIPFSKYSEVVLFGDHTLSLFKPKEPFLVATDGVKILSIANFDGNFTYVLLVKYKPKAEGYKRHFTILKTKLCCFPLDVNEQTQIGNFFQQLDKQITEQQNKLTHYQTLKKAMLQRLFI